MRILHSSNYLELGPHFLHLLKLFYYVNNVPTWIPFPNITIARNMLQYNLTSTSQAGYLAYFTQSNPFYNYIMPYVARIANDYFVTPSLIGSTFRSDGTGNINGGLFTRRSPFEMLFQFDSATEPLLVLSGETYYGPVGPLATSQDQDWGLNQLYGKLPNSKFTGTGNQDQTGVYNLWSNLSSITTIGQMIWHTPSCITADDATPRAGYDSTCRLWNSPEVILGSSDGANSPPFTEGDNAYAITPSVWIEEAKRVVPFTYNADVTFKGISMRQFLVNPNVLHNVSSGVNNPGAANYVMTHDPTGIAPLDRFYGGIDGILTFPHFLDADPDVINRLCPACFNPNNADHQSYLFIEPITGLTMSVRKRLQAGFNLNGGKIADFPNLSGAIYSRLSAYSPWANITWNYNKNYPLYIPYFWGSEGADVSDDDATTFKKIYTARKAALGITISFITVGGLMIIGMSILLYKMCSVKADGFTTTV